MAEAYIPLLDGIKTIKIISVDSNNEEVVTELDKRIKFKTSQTAGLLTNNTRALIQQLTTNTFIETRANFEFPIYPDTGVGSKKITLLTDTITVPKGKTSTFEIIFNAPIFGASFYKERQFGMFIPTNWTSGKAYISGFEKTDDETKYNLSIYTTSDFVPKANTNPTRITILCTSKYSYNYASNSVTLTVNLEE